MINLLKRFKNKNSQTLCQKKTSASPRTITEKWEETSLTTCKELCESGDFLNLKLPCLLNSKKLQDLYQKVKDEHKWISKDQDPFYQSLSLQYSDPQNSLYDGIPSLREQNPHKPKEGFFIGYTLWNQVGELFSPQLSELTQHFGLKRGRLMRLLPQGEIKEHADGQESVRLHIPIVANKKSEFYLNQKKLPPMQRGHSYLLRTSYPHSVKNCSDVERVHLIFDVTPNLSTFEWIHWLDKNFSYSEKKNFYQKYLNLLTTHNYQCDECTHTPSFYPVTRSSKATVQDIFCPKYWKVICRSCASKDKHKSQLHKFNTSYDLSSADTI